MGTEYVDTNLCFALDGWAWSSAVLVPSAKTERRHPLWQAARTGIGSGRKNLQAVSGGDGAVWLHGRKCRCSLPDARAATGRDKIMKWRGRIMDLHDYRVGEREAKEEIGEMPKRTLRSGRGRHSEITPRQWDGGKFQ